jgi:creatinine amidohydrolase
MMREVYATLALGGDTVFLEAMSWMDVERYLAFDDRIVVITGACEQHGYVSLLADILAPMAIAKAAIEQEPVLVAPPLPFGISPYFTAYPGTISLRVETFAIVVRELLTGLIAQGFRRILVCNGHGGNTGVLIPLLVELGNTHPETRFELFQWWTHPDVVQAGEKIGLPQRHANWSENFPFTRVSSVPAGEKPFVNLPRTANAAATRAGLGDGSYGGAYQAPDAVMESFFDAAVDAMVAALRAL